MKMMLNAALIAVVGDLMLGITSQAAEKPVKVFILAGQSNMVGHGKSEEGANPAFFNAPEGDKKRPRECPGGQGGLRFMVNHEPAKYGPKGTEPLVDADGNWLVDHDVKDLVDLIHDARKEFDKPKLPFVIATTSMFPPKSPRNPIELAQMAVADPQKYPQFKGNVITVDARPFWRDGRISPSNFGYHWNHNGITHCLIGEGMGEVMVKLLKSKFAGTG